MARSGSSSCADGIPNTPDHRVADELLDGAPERLDAAPRDPVVGAEEPVDVLGIEPVSELGGADEVAEQRRDDLALAHRLERGKRRSAAHAEARVVGVRRAAGCTGRHSRSVRRVSHADRPLA